MRNGVALAVYAFEYVAFDHRFEELFLPLVLVYDVLGLLCLLYEGGCLVKKLDQNSVCDECFLLPMLLRMLAGSVRLHPAYPKSIAAPAPRWYIPLLLNGVLPLGTSSKLVAFCRVVLLQLNPLSGTSLLL